MFEVILLIAVSVYFILLIVFTTGLKKKYPKSFTSLPSASVIVCARNEEQNIIACLNSLDKLKYPANKLEILIVDDFSTDKTGKLIDEFIECRPLFCKVIPEESGKLKGKINALNSGIKISKGEIILLTDADCTVNENWVTETASYFNKNTGMICGFTTLKTKTAFEAMQAIDVTFLLSVASGTANINKPVSCIGNNISFRKEAYIKTGGFENLPFSVTEDYLLMNEISKLKEYEIIFPLDEKTAVQSSACPDLSTLIKQKNRWAAGGKKSSAYGRFVMGTAFICNLLMVLVVLFFSTVSLYLAVFKIAIDYFFIYPVHKTLGSEKKLKYFILFEAYYILYTTLLPVSLLFSKQVIWKGRSY